MQLSGSRKLAKLESYQTVPMDQPGVVVTLGESVMFWSRFSFAAFLSAFNWALEALRSSFAAFLRALCSCLAALSSMRFWISGSLDVCAEPEGAAAAGVAGVAGVADVAPADGIAEAPDEVELEPLPDVIPDEAPVDGDADAPAAESLDEVLPVTEAPEEVEGIAGAADGTAGVVAEAPAAGVAEVVEDVSLVWAIALCASTNTAEPISNSRSFNMTIPFEVNKRCRGKIRGIID